MSTKPKTIYRSIRIKMDAIRGSNRFMVTVRQPQEVDEFGDTVGSDMTHAEIIATDDPVKVLVEHANAYISRTPKGVDADYHITADWTEKQEVTE